MRINGKKFYITFLPWYVTQKLDSNSYFTHDGCCDFRTQVIDRSLQPSTFAGAPYCGSAACFFHHVVLLFTELLQRGEILYNLCRKIMILSI